MYEHEFDGRVVTRIGSTQNIFYQRSAFEAHSSVCNGVEDTSHTSFCMRPSLCGRNAFFSAATRVALAGRTPTRTPSVQMEVPFSDVKAILSQQVCEQFDDSYRALVSLIAGDDHRHVSALCRACVRIRSPFDYAARKI